jgi:hypothetical protein
MQAQKGLSDTIKEVEDIKFKVYQKNRDEFLKNSNIDPEFIFSTSARETVQKSISNFNEKYGKIAQQYNYNLPDEVRMQMQTEKNLIIGEQQNQKAQFEMWRQHRELVANKPGVFSQEEFAKATETYMNEGRYTQTTPAYEPHDFGQVLNKAYMDEKNKIAIGMKGVGGGRQVEQYYTMDEGKYGGLIANIIATNPNARADILKKIEQNKEEVFADADVNGDKVLDSGEKENAIVNWIKKKYPRGVVEGTPVTIPGYGQNKSTSKFGTGWQRDGDIRYGGTTYSNNFAFNATTAIANVPIQKDVSKRLRGTYTTPILQNGSIKAQILEYNPDKDILVVRATVGNSALGVDSQDAIEIPASSLTGVDDIPIEVGGEKTTIGALRQGKTKQTGSSSIPPMLRKRADLDDL